MPEVKVKSGCRFQDILTRSLPGCTTVDNQDPDVMINSIKHYYKFWFYREGLRQQLLSKGVSSINGANRATHFNFILLNVEGAANKGVDKLSKLSALMFPHCSILPYTTDQEVPTIISAYYDKVDSFFSDSIDCRETQLRMIERMTLHEVLIDTSICEHLLDTFGSVTSLLKASEQQIKQALDISKLESKDRDGLATAILQFTTSNQDFYLKLS